MNLPRMLGHSLRRLRLAGLALIIVMEGIACGGGSQAPTGPPPDCTAPACTVSSVTVSPATATVHEGFSIQFAVTARDASGLIVTGVTFQWEVSDPAVAEIDASGRVTGKGVGQVQVRAIANGKVGSAELVVISTTVASLEIVAPPSLLVHETALFTVRARNADGVVVPTPPELQWTSSDETVARVEADVGAGSGVVSALRRGTVTINVSAGSVGAAFSLIVKARVTITFGNPVALAIGDTFQFRAFFVDVNGNTIPEIPSVTWASSNPSVASVSSTGLVIGLRTGLAAITATSSDGAGAMDVTVTDVIAGSPATVRFAHAAYGRGPVTFVPSQGAPVTLAFGESVEVPIVSGTFSVHVDGLGPNGSDQWWLIQGGDRLAIYGTGGGTTGWWINEVSVPADSGLVRFVNGNGPPNWAGTFFLGAPGAEAAESRLINCYSDGLEFSEYVRVPAGEFDVIATSKDATVERARVRATATSGRAVTYVLIGDTPETARALAFPDF